MRITTSWILAFVLGVAEAASPIEIDKAPIPARYSAALPANPAALRRWTEDDARFPPPAHVKDQVLLGDERWIARLGDAASKVSAADRAEWAKTWTNLTRFETATEGYCQQVRTIVEGPSSTLRDALIGAYAQTCASDEELALIVRADTPDSAVIEYYTAFALEFSPHKHPYHPRFESATRALILAGDSEARGAAFNLALHPDPRGRAALRRIHAEIRNQKQADMIALAFNESPDPAEKALTAAACKRMKDDPVCTTTITSADVQQPEPPPDPQELAAAKTLMAKLSAAGFGKVAALDPAKAAGTDASGVLTLAGHAYWFDVETDMFPNHHDSLMRSLARLVSPVLDDAVFEEKAPDIGAETAPYQLTVYAAGRRLRAKARNLGDWYDVDTVLNLLNATMKEIGSDIRFIPLPSSDQTLAILGAPKPVLDRAIKAGLFKVGDAGESERVGKEFEAQALGRDPD